ncbi:MAG: thermonuclease family protein [Candidatus Omnitrophica bacterium]|nr:thermonuclease family protein [Candidatus Omnitrophota bacterium]
MIRIRFIKLLFLFLFICSATQAANAEKKSNSLFLSLSSENKKATVEEITNPGLILLTDKRRIKLIGLKPVDPPKRKKLNYNEFNILIEEKENPTIETEEKAYEYANDLLKGKQVKIEFDREYRDKQGHLLGYIFLADGTLVNAEILRQGFADLSITPPNTKYETELREAYLEARKEKRGIQGD